MSSEKMAVDDALEVIRSVIRGYREDCIPVRYEVDDDGETERTVDEYENEWASIVEAMRVLEEGAASGGLGALYRAYTETRDFEFEGYGNTAEAAVEACHKGWLEHCRSYGEAAIDPSLVSVDDIGVSEVKIGGAYRDREEIRGVRRVKKQVTVVVVEPDGSRNTEVLAIESPDWAPVEDFWCECETPGESDYHPDSFDEEGNLVSKHHYTCRTCGRVTQIG